MKKINIVNETISILENDDVLYYDNIENFNLDSGLTLELPEDPWTGKLYIKNVYLRLFNNFTELTNEIIWEQGELILLNINSIIQAKQTRIIL